MDDDKPNLNEVIARASLIKLEEVSKPVLNNIRDIWLIDGEWETPFG